MRYAILPNPIGRTTLVGVCVFLGLGYFQPAVRAFGAKEIPDWIRGRGEKLELRLTGTIQRKDGGSVQGAEVQIKINYNGTVSETLKPKVDTGKFQCWIPVNKYEWYSLLINVTCPDGARRTHWIIRHQLREVAINGLEIAVQRPNRTIEVRVEHDKRPVPNATVRAHVVVGEDLRSTTDAQGIAKFHLIDGERPRGFAAWTNQKPRLIGGYFFGSQPTRDPLASTHIIPMYSCRTHEFHVKDANQQPVAGVELDLFANLVDDNYINIPDGFKLITNSQGIASFPWYPDIENVKSEVEMVDNKWKIQSSNRGKDKSDVVVKPAIPRVSITGKIAGNGNFPGGFSFNVRCFHEEEKHRGVVAYGFRDVDGDFTVKVLPDVTRGFMLLDDKWVAKNVHLIPYESKSKKWNSPTLHLEEGVPVRITLTQGNNNPIPGAYINFRSNHVFSWRENGEEKWGVLSRDISRRIKHETTMVMFAPEGKLEARARFTNWGAGADITVRRGQTNEIRFQRKITEPVEVVGKIVPWNEDSKPIVGATVHIKAMDGEADEAFKVTSTEYGAFEFKTKAMKLGLIAFSADKRFAGTLEFDPHSQTARLQFYPTKSYTGKITDQEGNPVANHKVEARVLIGERSRRETAYDTWFDFRGIETHTDAQGNYQINGIPCKRKVELKTDPLDENANYSHFFDEIYFYFPEEEPRYRVTKIGERKESAAAEPLAQRFASVQRDALLGNYHLLVMVSDKKEKVQTDFVNRHLLNSSEHDTVGSYMHLHLDGADLLADNNKDLAQQLGWTQGEKGVLACALDATGKVLGTVRLAPTDAEAGRTAHQFIEKHAPPRQDAEVKWNQAFAQAKAQNKRVWVRSRWRYCGPCIKLSRWIDDNRKVLEKDFVLLKIDYYRDVHGDKVTERLAKGGSVSLPLHAMYDAQGNMLANSYGPLGKIGYGLVRK